MTFDIAELLSLALRWLHLTAGIAWIGSSFYFVWLDNHLRRPEHGAASGELWSVHGGGFYHNQKYQVAPEQVPADLHWFKWEAYATWLSGFSLLVLIYYFGASSFLLDSTKAPLTAGAGMAMGLGSLVAGWLFYDLLCRSRLGTDDRMIGVVWFCFLVGAAIVLDRYLSSRAAYIHVGSMIGTAMVANVFWVIIPAQKKVVADLVARRSPDLALGERAKQRSVHNNYMTLPVLFIMISQHYPMTYAAERPWLVLGLLGLTGVAIRHAFNQRHRGETSPATIATIGVLAIAAVIYVSAEKPSGRGGAAHASEGVRPAPGEFPAIASILQEHCTSCHASRPTHAGFQRPPAGLVLETHAQAAAAAQRIKVQTIDTQAMPLGNETGMTDAERHALAAWIAKGTPE